MLKGGWCFLVSGSVMEPVVPFSIDGGLGSVRQGGYCVRSSLLTSPLCSQAAMWRGRPKTMAYWLPHLNTSTVKGIGGRVFKLGVSIERREGCVGVER